LYKNKKILAVILARAGSKRLKDKNIRLFNSKPLIYWTIKAAKDSNLLDKIVLSTDSSKISKITKSLGISVPFLRPKNLAKDKSSSINAILHCIDFLENQKHFFDYCILLEPTSPLRDAADIDLNIKKLINNKSADSLVSVSKAVTSHPQFMYYINKKSYMKPFSKKLKKVNRNQDSKKLFFLEGSIYMSKIATLKNKKTFYHSKTIASIFPKWKSFEVDDFLDLKISEFLLKYKNKKDFGV
jgi:N-acylneuraminate cytidylyltransferase/CMP-N,N'-diacetyllegionaminic acid synthase